jgi:hypothetical protein
MGFSGRWLPVSAGSREGRATPPGGGVGVSGDWSQMYVAPSPSGNLPWNRTALIHPRISARRDWIV